MLNINATIHNVNIRGCEAKTAKNGSEYLLVRFEDETGRASELVDKDMSRQPYYKRDTDMDLVINIDEGRNFTNVRIIDAVELKPASSGAGKKTAKKEDKA